ncbi:MAG TPA: VOC family protein [Jatrophihabitans sp.]|nr:VOC family protein [Jatrophihabitans sp.]
MVSPLGWLGLDPVTQLGIVTTDVDAAVERDLERRPGATWAGWTYGPHMLSWQRIDGRPASFEFTLAVSGANPQLEFVDPGTADTSLRRLLERHGTSLHHVGVIVEDFAAERARLQQLGIAELEAGGGHGMDGDGAFGYFDTVELCGVIVELIEPPARRPAPHRTYPVQEILL